MTALTYKGYTARVEFDADDGLLTGTLAGIDDCIVFQAESVPELKKEFRDAVDDYLQTCAQLAGVSLNAWVRGLLERGVAEQHAYAV